MIRLLKRATVRGFSELAPATAARWFSRAVTSPRRPRLRRRVPPGSEAARFRVRFEDGSVAVTRWGSGGEVVLLAHGWGSDSRSVWPLVDPLVQRGFSPVTLDLPAHGESHGSRTTFIQCADAIQRVAAAVGPVHGAVAHSGGAVALGRAIVQGMQVGRVVLIAPPRSVYDYMSKTADDAGLPEHVVRRVADEFSQRMQFDWGELDTDWMAARIDAPLLVVHDEDDRFVPWSHGAAVAQAAPLGALLTTAGLGHRAVLSSAQVIEAIATFVAGRRWA